MHASSVTTQLNWRCHKTAQFFELFTGKAEPFSDPALSLKMRVQSLLKYGRVLALHGMQKFKTSAD